MNTVEVRTRRQQELARRIRERELNDMRAVLNTAEGRRFVWRLFDKAGIFRTSFTGNSTTFFNEGQRNLGLLFFNDMMQAMPEAFALMQREQAELQIEDNAIMEEDDDYAD